MIGLTRSTSLSFAVASVALVACVGRALPNEDDLTTWQRTPLAPDQRLADAATRSSVCRSGEDDGAPIQLQLQDRRTASSAAFLVAGAGFSGSCMVTLTGGASGGSSRSAPVEAMRGPIIVDERSNGGFGSGTATLLGGRAAPNVARVQVDLADGTKVEASVGNGRWLAWWPGESDAVRVAALDGVASILATLDDSTPGWQQK